MTNLSHHELSFALGSALMIYYGKWIEHDVKTITWRAWEGDPRNVSRFRTLSGGHFGVHVLDSADEVERNPHRIADSVSPADERLLDAENFHLPNY